MIVKCFKQLKNASTDPVKQNSPSTVPESPLSVPIDSVETLSQQPYQDDWLKSTCNLDQKLLVDDVYKEAEFTPASSPQQSPLKNVPVCDSNN